MGACVWAWSVCVCVCVCVESRDITKTILDCNIELTWPVDTFFKCLRAAQTHHVSLTPPEGHPPVVMEMKQELMKTSIYGHHYLKVSFPTIIIELTIQIISRYIFL